MNSAARAAIAVVLPSAQNESRCGSQRGWMALGWPIDRFAAAAAEPFAERVCGPDDGGTPRAAVAGLAPRAPVLVVDARYPLLRARTLELLLAAARGAAGAITGAPCDGAAVLPREMALELLAAGGPAVLARARALNLRAVEVEAEELLTTTDPVERARVVALLRRRLVERLIRSGVQVHDPERAWVEATVEVAAGCELHPDVNLRGKTTVGAGTVLHQGAWVNDSTLGETVTVWPYSVLDGAEVGEGCRIGPFARLRPGTVLRRAVSIGNFVEVKKSVLEDGVKANHLAYLGDATVGRESNIGAGTVTCNYDGTHKHATTIGAEVFIGSDTMLVAPVRVGDGATTAAGSTINQDVPADALAVARPRQRNVPNWSKRKPRAS